MRINRKTQAVLMVFFLAAISGNVFANNHKSHKAKSTIVEIAASNDSFSTLVTAIKAAGLTDTLQNKGQFTVFAPSNVAFDKLPPGTLANLLKPENKQQLISVLTYHVLPGQFLAKDVAAMNKATTLQGAEVTIGTSYSGVTVDYARVADVDIRASNGVIHAIDNVILPKEIDLIYRPRSVAHDM